MHVNITYVSTFKFVLRDAASRATFPVTLRPSCSKHQDSRPMSLSQRQGRYTSPVISRYAAATGPNLARSRVLFPTGVEITEPEIFP